MKLRVIVGLAFTFLSTPLFGAKITKLFSKQRFKIDAGSTLGLAKGDKICSYDDAMAEIACGDPI